jgi:hypothetical protein
MISAREPPDKNVDYQATLLKNLSSVWTKTTSAVALRMWRKKPPAPPRGD